MKLSQNPKNCSYLEKVVSVHTSSYLLNFISFIVIHNYYLFLVDLSTSLTAEGLQAVLNNPEFVREVQRHLPPVSANGSSQQDLLRSTLASPQFQQVI